LLGNPNLNPQVAVNYELGAKHQFMPTAAANVSFFVKDIYDYPTATEFEVSSGTSGNPVPIFVYLNGHFARAKGFEIEVEKRRSNYWSGKLTYTFQQVKGKSSDPSEQKVVQSGGGDASETRLTETFVSWNRPHKLSASFDLRFDPQTPVAWLRQWGLNVFVQGMSGRPYTPVNERGDASGAPNSKNADFQMTTDLRINRWFQIGKQRLDISLAATNVFNQYVIYRVDPMTGHGRVWGEGSYDPNNPFLDVNEYVKVSQVDDPSNYGPGAQWRLSVDYDF
jgi:outer membrane receptor protein involved in Fe transport